MSSQAASSKEKNSPYSPPLTDWIEIGKVVGAQGLKGEVRVYPDSDFPERFEQTGRRWLLCPDETEPQPIELLAGRYLNGKGLYVVQFANVVNRDQAEALRNCRILVPASDRPPLEEGEFHVLDLIGLEVFNQSTQELVGVVVDVLSAGNDLLEVQLKQALENPILVEAQESSGTRTLAKKKSNETKPVTVLVPFVEAIVPVVDLQQRRIEITPPAGLIE